MAKCFDHIWSSSGQPTYKIVNILHSVLQNCKAQLKLYNKLYTHDQDLLPTYDQTELGSEASVSVKKASK